jgi:Ca-activated chloride channel homolog
MSRRIGLLALAFSLLAAVLTAQSRATVTGSVVDAMLKPLVGVVVTLERAGRSVASSITDANGVFTFADVASGTYVVRATHAGFPPFSKTLTVTALATKLQLPIVLMRPEDAIAPKAPDNNTARPIGIAAPPPPAQYPPVAGGRGGIVGGVAGSGGAPSMRLDQAIVYGRPVMERDQWTMYPPPNSETYTDIEPNRFQRTIDRPLSTFGADVDTASYSNARRFLSNGQLPPPEAIRVEEFVNYFRFAYAPPRNGKPMSLTTEIGDCPWAPSHKLVLIGARAAAPAPREIAGRNMVLLIDVSGSMEPQERLPLIKTALGLFVDTLRPDDTISIVTYAGTSGVALPPTPARQRNTIQRAIGDLRAGGSTNGASGLIMAYRTAREAFVPGGVNRVILATDGDFNVGVTSQQELLRLIERERDSGVFLSVFGVGSGNLKDATMEMLADKGNGNYAYLDSLREARRVLIKEADATLETVAKDVKFQVEFNPAIVSSWKLIGYEDRKLAARDFNNDRKDAGEMGANHTVTALYEIVPVGAKDDDGDRPAVDGLKYQQTTPAKPRPISTDAAHNGEWFTVKARYKEPDSDTSQLISQAVRPIARPEFLPLASAVAEFGLLLRDQPHDIARWDALTKRLAAIDVPTALAPEVAEMKELVATARGLAKLR